MIYVEFIVELLSRVWLFVTLWTAAHQASLSFTISQSLLKLTCIEFMRPSNHLILYYPLLLLPSSSPSIRVFSNEFVLQKGISILEQLLAGRGRLRLLFKMGAKVVFGVCQRNDIVEKRTLMIFSTLFWYFRSLSVLLKTVFISLMGFFFTFFFFYKNLTSGCLISFIFYFKNPILKTIEKSRICFPDLCLKTASTVFCCQSFLQLVDYLWIEV